MSNDRLTWQMFGDMQYPNSFVGICSDNGQSSATMKHVLDELNKSDANYFMNKTACALNPIKK